MLAPFVLWGIWWVTLGRTQSSLFHTKVTPTTFRGLAGGAGEILLAPFEHLSLGFFPFTVVLVVGFLSYGVWTLRQGLSAAASFLAWSAAHLVWAVGLAFARTEMTA